MTKETLLKKQEELIKLSENAKAQYLQVIGALQFVQQLFKELEPCSDNLKSETVKKS